jgi:lipoprotein-anchoring transpeptidase ErfK/SrfK
MTEWPSWTPTEGEKARLDVPDFVAPGPQNPMGARAMYLFAGNKDTLYRIHGTNQPEYIGQAISSGCIRMTNEDVIDLYKRVKQGTVVVGEAPPQNDSLFNPRVATNAGSLH